MFFPALAAAPVDRRRLVCLAALPTLRAHNDRKGIAKIASYFSSLMNAGLGTLMAYVGDDETVVCHPAHDHQFSADSLILMVREEAIPSEQAIRDCLAKRS